MTGDDDDVRRDPKEVEVTGSNPVQGFSYYNNNSHHQAELPRQLDEQSFQEYLLKTCKPNTAKVRLCYARRYASILTSPGIPGDLLQLSPQTRLNAMKALTALSKYLGCYEQWKNTIKQYNLKWTTGNESIASLERFFNPNLTLDSMLSKVREMMRVLPATMAAIIRFAVLTGLRPSEACESVRLICSPTNRYYNPEHHTLEHFRFPDIFLRTTKKAYLSYLSIDNYHYFANLGPKTPGWNAIRLTCRRRNINMDMRLCRKIHGSWLHKHGGISTEEIDFLQGRVSPSVFGRHYLTPDNSLKDRVLSAVSELEKQML
jgi:hypothetical protein